MLPDYLGPNLSVVFVGTSVATASAARGHYYAGPGNQFWALLWQAGLTDQRLSPAEDARVLDYGVGLTDVVKRVAASSDSLLKDTDYEIRSFLAKVENADPRVVAFNGKKAAQRVFRHLRRPEPTLGRSDVHLGSSHVFVLPSSSGANADPRNFRPKSSKAEWWCELGDFVRSLTG